MFDDFIRPVFCSSWGGILCLIDGQGGMRFCLICCTYSFLESRAHSSIMIFTGRPVPLMKATKQYRDCFLMQSQTVELGTMSK